jgi:mannose-6-phosphate isomerase-like protein (cupin superfamily)
MSDTASAARDLWFMNTRVIPCVACTEGSDALSVLEHLALQGDSPPLHVHHNEDEVFRVLDGELRVRIGDRETLLRAGATAFAPKGVPHSYRVESPGGARWLTITRGGDFERFVRSFSRPAERDGLPESSGPPTPEQAQALAAACAQYGIELVGPPLH